MENTQVKVNKTGLEDVETSLLVEELQRRGYDVWKLETWDDWDLSVLDV